MKAGLNLVRRTFFTTGLLRMCLLAGGVAALAPCTAMAQESARSYAIGGWGMTARQALAAPGTREVASGERSLISVITLGGGFRLHRLVAIEGTVELQGTQEFAWHYRYAVAPRQTDELATDRDVPVLAAVRVSPAWCGRVCPDVFVGGGVSAHRFTSVSTADCGTFAVPITPCAPMADRPVSRQASTTIPAVTAGAGVEIRTGARLTLRPHLRALWLRRPLYAVPGDHRRPHNTSGFLVGLGVGVQWHPR